MVTLQAMLVDPTTNLAVRTAIKEVCYLSAVSNRYAVSSTISVIFTNIIQE